MIWNDNMVSGVIHRNAYFRSADYAVSYTDPALSLPDLDEYLADAIRSDAMLAIVPQLELPGSYFRAFGGSEPYDLLSSWVSTEREARTWVRPGSSAIRATHKLAIVAMVIHLDTSFVEYVGRAQD